MVLILNGKQLSSYLADAIANKTANLTKKPKLAIIFVGNNQASDIYIRNKILYAKNVNIETKLIKLPIKSSKEEILAVIDDLNFDDSINGIIVQSPLPNDEYQNEIFDSINPKKDVDGFTSSNIGALCNGHDDCLIACTPLGILKLLSHYKINLKGKHVVILGRSKIVGRPLSILLSQQFDNCNATVTLCHSKSENLVNITQSADILISAVGKPKLITKNMIKNNVVIIDVGINRIEDNTHKNGYRLCGDVAFESVYDICSAITPVPGGVGPMTIATLMHNTLKAYFLQN